MRIVVDMSVPNITDIFYESKSHEILRENYLLHIIEDVICDSIEKVAEHNKSLERGIEMNKQITPDLSKGVEMDK